MKIVTSEQMRALDRKAIQEHGTASLGLMERAGSGLARLVRSLTGEGEPVFVVCGRGNNGGDGLVAARLLAASGVAVRVAVLGLQNELSMDAQANLKRLVALGIGVRHITDEAALETIRSEVLMTPVIVDAIFGTGLARDVQGLARKAIELMNASKARIVSADIPSGLSADSGAVHGIAVRAAATATFGLPKRGLFVGDGPEHAGRVEVVDIGIPEEEAANVSSDLLLAQPMDVLRAFPERGLNSHKGTYGHVLVFAGAKGHLGAGYLTSLAALRAGAGLVTYALPAGAFEKFDARYPEIMCDAIPDAGTAAFSGKGLEDALALLEGKNAFAVGPAIGQGEGAREFTNAVLARSDVPAVVDADGLNVLDMKVLEARQSATVLTPHPGEMAKLVGVTVSEVQADRIGVASAYAKRSGAIVVLKGFQTVVAAPDGLVSINPTGNPGMASAGMGDALSGCIASLLAQGVEPFPAARASVYIHGLAGDIAAREQGASAVIAGDVIERLGRAVEAVRQGI